MAMVDYSDLVLNLQRRIGEHFSHNPDILNIPGRSMACRVDEHYYLALEPMLVKKLSQWGAIIPSRVVEALLKTGNLISHPSDREHVIQLRATWEGLGKFVRIQACFVLAEFMDRGLKIYAGQIRPLPLSPLYVHSQDRSLVEEFFGNKTPPASWIYVSEPG